MKQFPAAHNKKRPNLKVLAFTSFGSSNVLKYVDTNNPVLKPAEILVEMKAIGLNYADIMRRSGIYPVRGNAPL